MSSPADPPDSLAPRIMRLEEALGFAQHENSQLSTEVAALGKRVLELSRKLEALDQKLSESAAAKSAEEPNNDPPPHSAPPMTR